ncbi:hypothetical protein TSTA_107200 [Talaromyces stipitatus ATCC 10500]|uniref:Uncharacterized protein n=1 Tax=Talaromyces stipitatus (strain ATCC 10500 / CBS 375.48 / QM 6759 / NRRL 1006) TaxID=441959 RepID=B8MN64_TALSN|nr:uncharacterized protein TSTA_107200 [Talaromyces stipitatus ATCC 10500]EED14513.1 hypothetical protein TSTA_107200 [Talaromyces stipitatus ATCC 10500]
MSSPSGSANGEGSRDGRTESRLPTWDDARASAYFNFDFMNPKSLKGVFLLGLGYSVAASGWSSFQAYRGRRLDQEEERRAEEAREREEETRRRQAEFLRQLHEDLGIDAEAGITQQEITTARDEINYVDEAMNIVVTGNLNAGKSSLINALRNSTLLKQSRELNSCRQLLLTSFAFTYRNCGLCLISLADTTTGQRKRSHNSSNTTLSKRHNQENSVSASNTWLCRKSP